MAQKTDVIIIGAGQAGLAMSRCLTALGLDHLVLDRGATAGRWQSERWASLRLLTPNWMTRLPGFAYDGADPNGYMHKDELVGYLNRYARSFAAPVREFTNVLSVSQAADGFRVVTDGPTFLARAVVVASGACDLPNVPDWAARLPRSIAQVTTNNYVHPDQLETGGVLVVGGSATGVQLAEEIQHSGRATTLACGSHVSLPRTYRGHDIMRWMDACGLLDDPRDHTITAQRALAQPSLQLIGDTPQRNIGLSSLMADGVRCIGRIEGADGAQLSVAGNLRAQIEKAHLRTERVLTRIDAHIAKQRTTAPRTGPRIPAPSLTGDPKALNLADAGIKTVVWATGFRREYPWLRVPVIDSTGEIRQSGGITPVPGLYTLGLPFMRRRKSTFIDGVGPDAHALSHHLSTFLGQTHVAAA